MSSASGKAFPKSLKTSCSLKVVCIFLCATLTLLHSLPKGEVHWVPADWFPLPSIEVPVHRPGSSAGASAGHLGRMGHWEEHTPLKALECRGHSVVLVSEGLTSDCRDVERCMDLSGQLLYISHFWCGGQLFPPLGCVQLVGPPFQPQLIVLY